MSNPPRHQSESQDGKRPLGWELGPVGWGEGKSGVEVGEVELMPGMLEMHSQRFLASNFVVCVVFLRSDSSLGFPVVSFCPFWGEVPY